MHILLDKVKEVLFSVLPITIIVLLVHFFIVPLPLALFARFLLGALFIVIGLSVFLFGVDIGISPLGQSIGTTLSKSNKISLVAVSGLILGFFISVAEPDLQILANQVSAVTSGVISNVELLLVVSAGIGFMMVFGFLRVVYNLPLNWSFLILYGIIAVASIFVSPSYLAISFDASGATTGALTVPFILALSMGVSALKKDSKSSENDSFGLVGITSTGAIIGVLIMGNLKKIGNLTGTLPQQSADQTGVFSPFLEKLPHLAVESFIALFPIFIIFLVAHFLFIRFRKNPFKRIIKGLLYTLIGLILFLTGVNAGFMDVGSYLGAQLALQDNKLIVLLIGFMIGFVTILAEPAVHVLTDQIEEVTAGYIRKNLVLGVLAIGVGLAIGLSVLRILVPGIMLWHYLLPGYLISIILSFAVPSLFVGIAFDSGGVASGPMTTTFVLAFVQGIAYAIPGADVLNDAFGMIALVAMTPIITLQILGLVVKIKSRKRMVKTNG